MKIIEKELKYEISKEYFYKIKTYLEQKSITKKESVTQINFYIDTQYLSFKEKDITIRIRQIFDHEIKYEFTIKTPLSVTENSPHIKIKNEFSIGLDEEIAIKLIKSPNLSEYKSLLSNLFHEAKIVTNLEELKVLGNLKTVRDFYIIDNRYEPINLDLNTYLGKEDYEIEWETEFLEENLQILNDIFYELKVANFKTIAKSKNFRFFNEFIYSYSSEK